MFVIIGTELKNDEIGCLPEPQVCPRCQRMVQYQAFREQRWITVFWTPLIPVQSSWYFQCPCCGLTYRMSKNQMMDLLSEQKAVTDESTDSAGTSLLEKGARQAGRWYGRLVKRLDEMDEEA